MKCFYYKWVSKKDGKVVLSNFDWAESFSEIKAKHESRIIACSEISHEEFMKIRKELGQGY